MKIVDSRECPLCNNTPETIEHAFLECQKIHTLSRQIEVWLGMVLRDNMKISDPERVFGTAYKNSILDTVILLTMKKIYKNRQEGQVTNIVS